MAAAHRRLYLSLLLSHGSGGRTSAVHFLGHRPNKTARGNTDKTGHEKSSFDRQFFLSISIYGVLAFRCRRSFWEPARRGSVDLERPSAAATKASCSIFPTGPVPWLDCADAGDLTWRAWPAPAASKSRAHDSPINGSRARETAKQKPHRFPESAARPRCNSQTAGRKIFAGCRTNTGGSGEQKRPC